MKMASITAVKDPGFLFSFLAGLLLSLTLVSGQSSTTSSPSSSPSSSSPSSSSPSSSSPSSSPSSSSPSSSSPSSSSPSSSSPSSSSPSSSSPSSSSPSPSPSSSGPASPATSMSTYMSSTTNGTSTSWNTSPMSMISCPNFICNYSDCSTMYNSQNASMCTGAYCQIIRLTDICYNASCSDVCENPCVNDMQIGCCVDCCNSTGCLNATFASMISSTAMATTIGPTNWTNTSGNSWNSTLMSMISCPNFICNYSDCNTMYNSQNASMCTGAYCQIIRLTDICYNASCSDLCENPCVNDMQIGCCVDCCNSTGCLNGTFASMLSSTTIATTIVTTPSATTRPSPVTIRPPATTAKPATTATTNSNANKCHTATCENADCYKSFSDKQSQPCAASEMHCELKRDTVNSKVKWTAGCTTSCEGGTWCQTASKPLSCHQECCNATKTSCLQLDGKRNVPSLATRGPHFHMELICFLICLLCFGSLM